ncbi:MAG: hypothetical protein K1060chlam2_00776 [Chlamydiae bacterium]|nr:hypothetical protein [Chlamydiota bacterium]
MSEVESVSEVSDEMDFSLIEPAEVSLIESGQTYPDSCYQVSRALNDRIIETNFGNRSIYIIDNAVKVFDQSKMSRQEKVQFWKSRRLKASIVLGIGAFGAVALGVLAIAIPILGVGAALSGVFAAYCLWKVVLTNSQVTNWRKDLPKAIADQRKEVFERGFLIAMSKGEPKPYSVILNQVELQGLYYDYFTKFVGELQQAVTSKNKVALMERSTSEGPLSRSALKVAKLSEWQFNKIKGDILNFNSLVSNIKRIIGSSSAQQSDLTREIKERIRDINREKSAALLPDQQAFKEAKRRLDLQRLDALRHAPRRVSLQAYRNSVEADYRKALKELEINFNFSKENISRPFDNRIKQEKDLLERFVKNINKYKIEQLLPFFNPLMGIQHNALQALSYFNGGYQMMEIA